MLLQLLKDFHDLAERRNLESNGLEEEELQNYGWVGSMIAIINIILKYIQLNFSIFENGHPTQQKGPKLPLLDLS